jgi:ribosomal-protein-alanine N-acetyltransferase
MVNLTIRARTDNDLDALTAVLQESHVTDRYPVMSEHVSAAWLTHKGNPAWVAELDGAVVGHAAVAGVPPGPLELTRLVVASSARGFGAANALLDAVEQYAASVGCEVYLEVLEHNSAAMKLYERRGWRQASSERVDWFGSDGPHPVVHRYVKT